MKICTTVLYILKLEHGPMLYAYNYTTVQYNYITVQQKKIYNKLIIVTSVSTMSDGGARVELPPTFWGATAR